MSTGKQQLVITLDLDVTVPRDIAATLAAEVGTFLSSGEDIPAALHIVQRRHGVRVNLRLDHVGVTTDPTVAGISDSQWGRLRPLTDEAFDALVDRDAS